jgi:hypothetical protein
VLFCNNPDTHNVLIGLRVCQLERVVLLLIRTLLTVCSVLRPRSSQLTTCRSSDITACPHLNCELFLLHSSADFALNAHKTSSHFVKVLLQWRHPGASPGAFRHCRGGPSGRPLPRGLRCLPFLLILSNSELARVFSIEAGPFSSNLEWKQIHVAAELLYPLTTLSHPE